MNRIIVLFLLLIISACKNTEPILLSFKNILVFGNSITIHPPNSSVGWFGNYGMAASSKENDYVNIMASKLNSNVTPVNISAWEGSHQTFNLSDYDKYFVNIPDLVIIRLGENVNNPSGFDKSLQTLINYIKSKAPKSKILITGTFWTNKAIDDILKNGAVANEITFVPLSQLDTKENLSEIGAITTSVDGSKIKISNQGVANHPGDVGMKNIAGELIKYIELISK
ncbi:SGNH/GDSL hydrolase family protein [Daejeonella sp.]|jgi:hypothetical protein|uniref:SGNH/GDSL hydrolase family protein n=1 Tax=Daejeonella sp. TaxID=2805397 RepID=UPI0037BF3845